MREILLRGKRIDNGEWVEGGSIIRFCPENNQRLAFMPQKYAKCVATHDDKDNIMAFEKGMFYKVNPETVGQYTGLRDINGKKIFEGDILQVDIIGGVRDRCIVGFGEFRSFDYEKKEQVGFYLHWECDKQAFHKYANICFWLRERKAICIGNIHDNPELTGEKV